MAYGLPVPGEPNWADKVNNSVEAVKGIAEGAAADADSAQSNANYAKNKVDSIGELDGERVSYALTNDEDVQSTLSATIVDSAGTIAGSDRRQIWSLDPAVAGGSHTPAQRTAYLQSVLAEVATAGGGTINVPGVEFVFSRTGAVSVPGLHDVLFQVPANTRIVGIAGSKFTLDPATAPSATGLLFIQWLGSNITTDGVEININEGYIDKRSRVATKQLTTNVATIVTQTPHRFQVGDVVTIGGTENVSSGSTSSAINGNQTVASVVNSTTFTVAVTAANQALSTVAYGWVQLVSSVGGSIWLMGSRRLSGDVTRVDNIAVSRCRFFDFRIAITASRSATTDLGVDQWTNWSITDCHFEVCSNRAIELHQINGLTIARNTFKSVATTVHLIGFTRNFLVDSNRGTCGTVVSPMCFMINFGVTDGLISRNAIGYDADVYSTASTLRFHTEPTVPAVNTVGRITFSGNRWLAPVMGTTKRSLTFLSATGNTDNEWVDLIFNGDVFTGDVLLYTSSQQSIGHIRRTFFNACEFSTAVLTLAAGTFDLVDTQVVSCWFKSATAQAVLASRMAFSACRFAATPTIDTDADKTIIANSITPAAIASAGTNTQLSNNLVLA